MPNLLNGSLFKISDRKDICQRVQAALLRDPDCVYPVRGPWREPSRDEHANWEARQHFLQASLTLLVDRTLVPISAEQETGSPDGDLAHTPDQISEA